MRDLLSYHGLKLPVSGSGVTPGSPINGITKIELAATADGQTEWTGLTIPSGELLAFYMGSVLQTTDYTYTPTTFNLVEGIPNMHELLIVVLTPVTPVSVETRVIGEIKMLAVAASLDPGWVVCDGTIYDAVDYPDAIAKLGTTYGGDGATTFGVPDFRGRVAIATAPDKVLGTSGGQANISLSANHIPAHSHAVEIPAAGTSTGASTTPDPSKVLGVDSPGDAAVYSTDAANTTLKSFDTADSGVGDPFSVMQPYLVMNFIIYLGHPA